MVWSTGSGVDIYFECSGKGNRSLILIHELGGALESWDAVVPFLEPHFRILRYDQRGAGRSEKVRAAFTLEDQVRDLEALIATAGLQPPYMLVGLAAGASLALLFTQRQADQVSALVLCCPSIGVDRKRKGYLIERSELGIRGGMGAIVDASLARSYPEEVIRDRSAYDSYRARYLDNDPVSYGLANQALAAADFEPTAGSVTCRCLVLAGARDKLRPPGRVRALARRFANCEFAIVDGGHLLPVQAPEAVAERLIEFLLRVESHDGAGRPSSKPPGAGST